MQLNGLKQLYGDMKNKNIERYQFKYKNGKGEFDIFFFIDQNPFILLFGAKGANFSFEIEVKKGFYINIILDTETYNKLKKFLGIEDKKGDPFSPFKFFENFNSHIPTFARIQNKAEPHQIIQYRNDVEESEKKYYWKWRDNEKRGDQVSPENLEKTKKLLGEDAYKRCKNKNISSCWTSDVNKRKDITLP